MSKKSRDRAARSSAAGLGALIGAVIGGPGGAVVGSVVGVALEPLLGKVWDELGADSRQASLRMAEVACDALGETPEAFVERASADPQARLLTGLALSAASRTRYDPKIRALGRALADGLIAEDEAQLDTQQLIVRALDDLEAPHVAVLDMLVTKWPGGIYGGPVRTSPFGERPQNVWTLPQLNAALARLAPAMPSLLGTLQRHGLAVEAANLKGALEGYQDASARASSSGRRRVHGFRPPEPFWNATPLANQMLEYLSEVGRDNDDEVASHLPG